jgi:6-phosphogluconate dehydrogenase
MCPGGDDESLGMIMPLLQKVAAKDKNGNPCVGKAGTGGSGHYIKMIHNGIEHGMMSAISEAWQIMSKGLGMSLEEIGETLAKWNDDGQLRGTFLISIGAEICWTKDESGKRVLETVEDKVVQDFTGEEGTGIWANEEAVSRHIPAPTLTTAHFFRLASAKRSLRIQAKEAMRADFGPQPLSLTDAEKSKFVEDLRIAVYIACLGSYIQGMNIIEQADRDNKWNVDYAAVLQIWRAGCIIQADYLAELLEPIFEDYKARDSMNLLLEPTIAKEFKNGFPSLRKVVVRSVENDFIIPALSATLEYIKYQTNTGTSHYPLLSPYA